MKLLIVIINNRDAEEVLRNLIEREYRVTRIASTGGFLRRGNTTLLIGTQADRVDLAIDTIRESCSEPEEPNHRRATVFVVDTFHYEQV